QAEDGIRDLIVTGVQTCALPISCVSAHASASRRRMEHTPIVDADGHVLEPPSGMAQRAPQKFRDRIWQIVTKPDGSEWLRYNGGERRTYGMALAGTAGMSLADRERARSGKMKYSEVRPGAFEPQPRLADMDTDGIQQSVLYP